MNEPSNTSTNTESGPTAESASAKKGKERLKHVKGLDIATLEAIRRILCLPSGAPFPRCRARTWGRVHQFERKGDYTHSGKHHVCPVCRCKNVAGHATHGDFYGLGQDTGHYGVGFCAEHEKSKPRKGHCITYAINHMKALQQFGQGVTARQEMELVEKVETDHAEQKIECRRGLKALLDQLTSVEQQLKGTPEAPLTEYVMGRLVDMSDKTKIDLLIRLADRTAAVEKIVHDILPPNTVSMDEIRVRLKQTMSLTERIITAGSKNAKEDMSLWLEGIKEIWIAPPRR